MLSPRGERTGGADSGVAPGVGSGAGPAGRVCGRRSSQTPSRILSPRARRRFQPQELPLNRFLPHAFPAGRACGTGRFKGGSWGRITPTVLYGLDSCSITSSQHDWIDALQRKMLRRVVGWVHQSGDTWETSGRRMKNRLDHALSLVPLDTWSCLLLRRKQHVMSRLQSAAALPLARLATRWNPVACARRNECTPHRKPGHPRRRWHDGLN